MEGLMEEKKGKGFTVKDKRVFSQDGDTKEQSKQEPSATQPHTGEAESRQSEDSSPPLPDVTFSSFILSMSSSALFHFGELPDPISNEKKKNIPLAKQTIDILGLLQDKTVGNLTEEEASLLENLLYDLRMRYVAEKNKDKP